MEIACYNLANILLLWRKRFHDKNQNQLSKSAVAVKQIVLSRLSPPRRGDCAVSAWVTAIYIRCIEKIDENRSKVTREVTAETVVISRA